MTSMNDLKERAKREQEQKRRDNNRSVNQQPFVNDGFFESTNYSNWDTPSSSDSGGSSSGD